MLHFRTMGRNIIFNNNLVIEQITSIFHTRGYKNTTLADIEIATGVKKASLHHYYGNKHTLFKNSLKFYSKRAEVKWESMGSGEEFIRSFFKRHLDSAKGNDQKIGCLIMNCLLEFSAKDDHLLKKEVMPFFKKIIVKLKKEIDHIPNLDPIVDTKKVAKSLVSIAFSIRELSKITNDPEYFEVFEKQVNSLLLSIKHPSL